MPESEEEFPANEPMRFPIPLGRFLNGLVARLREVGRLDAAALVAPSTATLSLRDHGNGEMCAWFLALSVGLPTFARLRSDEKAALEQTIAVQAQRLLDPYEDNWFAQVLITPQLLSAVTAPLDPAIGYPTREHFFASRELEFERELGSGGFGEVVLVRHRHLGTSLAIKFFNPSPFNVDTPARREKARARLTREGTLLAGIRHHNVVRLLDSSVVSGDPALVLEYVDGLNLDAVRQKRGTLPTDETIDYVCQLLDAVGACHAREVVHRDVAPKNVVMEKSGRIVLIDFGLGISEELRAGERMTSQPFNNPGFSAPELLEDPLSAGPAADLYSVGAVAVFLLTGRPPQTGRPIDIPGVPAPVIVALRRALAADPSRRPSSALEMKESLRPPQRPSAAPPHNGPSPLANGEVREVLGLPEREPSSPEIVTLATQFAIAVATLAHAEVERDAGLALLVVAGRYQVGVLRSQNRPEERCDPDELSPALAAVLAALTDAPTAPPPQVLVAAFARATANAWISKGEYDSWRPGMASGSGIRDCYSPTALGRRWLKAETAFDPPAEGPSIFR